MRTSVRQLAEFAILMAANAGFGQSLVSFSESSYQVTEDYGALTLDMVRRGNTNEPVTVAYFTSDGLSPGFSCSSCSSALRDIDYSFAAGALVFAPGEITKSINIPLLDNGRVDGDRWFIVSVVNPASVCEASVTIHDNEVPAEVDLSFNPSCDSAPAPAGPYSPFAAALAVQPDGRIIVGGTFGKVNGVGRTNLVRLNSDGSLDTNFIANTSLYDSGGDAAAVSLLNLQTNGQLIVGGRFTSINGVRVNGLARLKSNGLLDTNFNAFTGIRLTDPVTRQFGYLDLRALAVQPDGKLLIGGTFDNVNGVSRTNLARLNTNGSLDATFLAGTEKTWQFVESFPTIYTNATVVSALALQPDGKILVGGTFHSVNGTDRTSIARLKPDGSLDSRFFVGDGVERGDEPGYVKWISIRPTGAVMLGGWLTSAHGIGVRGLVSLNPAGWPENTFDAASNFPFLKDAVAFASDGSFFIGGTSRDIQYRSHLRVDRLQAEGANDERFHKLDVFGVFNGMATQPDGKALVAWQSQGRNQITRLYPDKSQPVVQFARYENPKSGTISSDVTVGENMNAATLSVQRLGDTSAPLAVNYATSDGTAKAGIHYAATRGRLEFARLQITNTITVPIFSTAASVEPLSFRVNLSDPNIGELGIRTVNVRIQNPYFGFPPGGITLQLAGLVNLKLNVPDHRAFSIETSTNLINWTQLIWNWGGPAAVLDFSNIVTPGTQQRFYRARW